MSFFALCLLLAITGLSQAEGYEAGQIFLPGDNGPGTQQPDSCISDVAQDKTYTVTPDCSPDFFKYCYEERLNGSFPAKNSYSPNCLGQTNQDQIKNLLSSFTETIDEFSNKTEDHKIARCMKLLIPFLCGTFYPIGIEIPMRSQRKMMAVRISPCKDFCEDVVLLCTDAGVPIPSQLNCTDMFTRHCPPVKNDFIPSCMHSPFDPSDCFKECPTQNISTCNKRTSKCHTSKQVRTSISGKKFGNFQFAAQVQVLKEVELCEPINSIAYKVQIVHDYYLDCKKCDKYSRHLTSGSITYILSTDSITNCSKRCVQPKIKPGNEYFMMATLHQEEILHTKCGTNIWVLDSVQEANSVLFPWDKVSTGKRKRISKLVEDKYACTKTCSRE